MARHVDIKGLEKLRDNLEMADDQIALFMESCAKELAARLLAKVVKRTPTGEYPSGSGKVGGTLKRGWTAGKASNAKAYVASLPVHHFGNEYVIVLSNPVDYASYVEYGHRNRGGKGWTEGKFMLTISENELNSDAPKIIERKIKKMLEDALGGK